MPAPERRGGGEEGREAGKDTAVMLSGLSQKGKQNGKKKSVSSTLAAEKRPFGRAVLVASWRLWDPRVQPRAKQSFQTISSYQKLSNHQTIFPKCPLKQTQIDHTSFISSEEEDTLSGGQFTFGLAQTRACQCSQPSQPSLPAKVWEPKRGGKLLIMSAAQENPGPTTVQPVLPDGSRA